MSRLFYPNKKATCIFIHPSNFGGKVNLCVYIPSQTNVSLLQHCQSNTHSMEHFSMEVQNHFKTQTKTTKVISLVEKLCSSFCLEKLAILLAHNKMCWATNACAAPAFWMSRCFFEYSKVSMSYCAEGRQSFAFSSQGYRPPRWKTQGHKAKHTLSFGSPSPLQKNYPFAFESMW